MFADNFPAFAALLALVSAAAQDATASGESISQKLSSFVNLAGPLVTFLPQLSSLGSEIDTLKGSPADIEAAAEQLVTDLAFTSAKAKAIVSAAFPLAEQLVACIAPTQALIAAIES